MEKTYIEPFKITNEVFNDIRGGFSPFNFVKDFNDFNIYQLNTVITKKPYTFRGMHWQEPPYDQSKLIRCTLGKIIDFVVDIRGGSPNFGKSYSFVLSNSQEWVFIPRGFAHGYINLPHNLGDTYPTTVEYLVDNHYNPGSERGMFITKQIHDVIANEVPMGTNLNMNDRDLTWPTIDEIKTNFKYEPEEQ